MGGHVVGIAEAFALLFLGLVAGILSTVFDVVVVGSGAFVAHFALWALLNALIAIHVESRLKAIWWAIPFNLGYIECYYLCTSATFEGYARSLMVPIAAMAIASPMLAYALWTAKRDRGLYGKVLSLLIAVGVVVAGYYLCGDFDPYTIVVSVVLLLILWFWPARRLRFTPAIHPAPEIEEEQDTPSMRRSQSRSRRVSEQVPSVDPIDRMDFVPYVEERAEEEPVRGRSSRREQPRSTSGRRDQGLQESGRQRDSRQRESSGGGSSRRQRRRTRDDAGTVRRQQPVRDESAYELDDRSQRRTEPTRRSRRTSSDQSEGRTRTTRTTRTRQTDGRTSDRDTQRRQAAQRRTRRERTERDSRDERGYYGGSVSTLGTARSARPTSRSDYRRY